MKTSNRFVYAVIGVIVLLLAGQVYAWSVMGSVINREFHWDAAQLSLCFTIVMAMFCVGCLIAGAAAKKLSPKVFLVLSGCLFLSGFYCLPLQRTRRFCSIWDSASVPASA